MSSTDSPAEGLSSYAVEMAEVGQMLDVVTPRSLVFIDELGRGTEASHGTAMAGAVIEALDAAGARGVFATHLHGLLDLDLDLSPFARRARMETATVAGGRVAPTWRMVPGECRESLALQTAVDMGVNDAVVRRSEALLRRMIEREETAKTRVGGTASGDRGGEADESVAASTRTTAAPAPAIAPPLSELFASLVDAASSSSGGSIDPSTAGVVGVDDVPPAAARAWTCVYVLRRSDGWAYCGETDDLAGRLARTARSRGEEALSATSSARSCRCRGKRGEERGARAGDESHREVQAGGDAVALGIGREEHELRKRGRRVQRRRIARGDVPRR